MLYIQLMYNLHRLSYNFQVIEEHVPITVCCVLIMDVHDLLYIVNVRLRECLYKVH